MDDKIVEKLAKLLRLSGSSNEHEASLALERAQELAIKHGIELATVEKDSLGTKKEVVSQEEIAEKFTVERKEILRLLAWHFNIGIAYTRNSIFIYGTPSDKEFALYLYAYLKSQYAFLWKLKRMGGILKNSASYYAGLTAGISLRLRATEQSNQQWGLIVRDKKQAIDEFMQGKVKKSNRKDRYQAQEYYSGVADSSKVNLNRPIGSSQIVSKLIQ